MTEPVRQIDSPLRLTYQHVVGTSESKFMRAMRDGRFIGQRCSSCGRVYVAMHQGLCSVCTIPLAEEVEVGPRGTILKFCIVNIPSPGLTIDLPYVIAHIRPDGSDGSHLHLVQEAPVEDIRLGMRVEAVWAPKEEWEATLMNIRYWRPVDEPDVPLEEFKESL